MKQFEMYFIGFLILTCLSFGWVGRGYYEDSQTLREERGAQAAIAAERVRESELSKVLEEKLTALEAKKWVVYRDREKIVERPVYRNVCLDDAGLQLINKAKRSATTRKHADPMPGPP